MNYFNKILVPVDFSAQSKAAVEKGFALARQCHSNEIHLLSVIDVNTFGSFVTIDTYAFEDTGLVTTQIEKSNQMLSDLIEGITDKGGTKITAVVIEGDYIKTLIKYTRQFGIDLVIMPASSRLGIRQFLIGTNTHSIFAVISCPVLAFQPMGYPDELKRIVIPVEELYPINKLHYAIILAKLIGAEIHLVCLKQKLHSLQKSTYSVLLQISEQLEITGIRYKIYAADGKSITDVILKYTEREQIDLMLVNPREQSIAAGSNVSLLGGQVDERIDSPSVPVKKGDMDSGKVQDKV